MEALTRFAPETRRLIVRGHTLVSLVAGHPQQPAIVMVHGWCHHPDVWLTTMAAFHTTHYCVAAGILGLGESDKPRDGNYGIFAQGEDMLAMADALGIDRFILMGQSRGGQIALALSGRIAPERVIKLVDVSGVVTGQLSWYMRTWMTLPIWLGAQHPAWYKLFRRLMAHPRLATCYYRPYMDDPRRFNADFSRREILRALQPEARYSNYACMQTMRATNVLPCLPDISAPTLILFGKQDGVVPVAQGYLASRHIPNADLVVLDRCGHYPMYEQPASYISNLRAFLTA